MGKCREWLCNDVCVVQVVQWSEHTDADSPSATVGSMSGLTSG